MPAARHAEKAAGSALHVVARAPRHHAATTMTGTATTTAIETETGATAVTEIDLAAQTTATAR
jgi:hypothetical protein